MIDSEDEGSDTDNAGGENKCDVQDDDGISGKIPDDEKDIDDDDHSA